MGKKMSVPTNRHPTMARFNPPKVAGKGVAQGTQGKFPVFPSNESKRYKAPKS